VLNPIYIDRLERKFQVEISDDGVTEFWRDLGSFLNPYGLAPVQEITAVGTVYFDNQDYDLLRYILLIRRCHILFRLRAYEYYGRPPEPISEYWVEVKIRNEERRRKKRFRIKREVLNRFLGGQDVLREVLDDNREESDAEAIRGLYHEIRETFFTFGLRPVLLVTYKRVAFQNDNGNERLSLDWDIQYYHVTDRVYSYDTWKYLAERPAGKAKEIVMELKYPLDSLPRWIADLQRTYPLREKNYVKPVEGMGFLFQGPLRFEREMNSFPKMIEAYKTETNSEGYPLAKVLK
jgi:SPX domain protein involved in polyphosphate accumulation